ncbi:hypothetical protein BKA83DRAFT_4131072 [Pisolithus microcarpus]|nr:hypothetical protein BKA83DRAFT_4131072 [Pisolithus microcarpus]
MQGQQQVQGRQEQLLLGYWYDVVSLDMTANWTAYTLIFARIWEPTCPHLGDRKDTLSLLGLLSGKGIRGGHIVKEDKEYSGIGNVLLSQMLGCNLFPVVLILSADYEEQFVTQMQTSKAVMALCFLLPPLHFWVLYWTDLHQVALVVFAFLRFLTAIFTFLGAVFDGSPSGCLGCFSIFKSWTAIFAFLGPLLEKYWSWCLYFGCKSNHEADIKVSVKQNPS